MAKPRLQISKINQSYRLGENDYFKEACEKKQIYLHHTVSHPSPVGDVRHWKELGYRIGTFCIIAGTPYPNEKDYVDGEIFQCFSSKYWAFHLASHASWNKIPAKYKTTANTRMLERAAIGIEICNAGYLNYKMGKFYSTFGTVIPEEQVIEYSDLYRGQQFYHKYSKAQIESLRQLLVYLCETYNITNKYQEDMWDISENALSGNPGIFSHTSVRADKTDIHPQPDLVQMLRELETDEQDINTDTSAES